MVMKIPALWFTVISRPSKETTFAWVLIAAWINCTLWEMALICSSKSRLNSSKHPTRSTAQHLFASVEGERTVLFSAQANQTPYEYSQVTGAIVEYRLASCDGTCRGGKSFLKGYETSVTDARGPGENFCMSVARTFEQAGSLEKGLICIDANSACFPFSRPQSAENTVCSHTIDACFLFLPGMSKIVSPDPK